jgi:hypothetical protein
VRARTGRDDWALWAAAVALAVGFLAAMPLRRRDAPAEPEADADAAEAESPVAEAPAPDQPAEAPSDAPSDQPSAV